MNHKVVVVSDSHSRKELLFSMLEQEAPFDHLIHCGDGVDDLTSIDIDPQVQLLKVRGNMDRWLGQGIERMLIAEIGTQKILITHGDLFGVNQGFAALLREGQRVQADIILFGHTHESMLREGRPTLFNPGPAKHGQYGVIHIEQTVQLVHKQL